MVAVARPLAARAQAVSAGMQAVWCVVCVVEACHGVCVYALRGGKWVRVVGVGVGVGVGVSVWGLARAAGEPPVHTHTHTHAHTHTHTHTV